MFFQKAHTSRQASPLVSLFVETWVHIWFCLTVWNPNHPENQKRKTGSFPPNSFSTLNLLTFRFAIIQNRFPLHPNSLPIANKIPLHLLYLLESVFVAGLAAKLDHPALGLGESCQKWKIRKLDDFDKNPDTIIV